MLGNELHEQLGTQLGLRQVLVLLGDGKAEPGRVHRTADTVERLVGADVPEGLAGAPADVGDDVGHEDLVIVQLVGGDTVEGFQVGVLVTAAADHQMGQRVSGVWTDAVHRHHLRVALGSEGHVARRVASQLVVLLVGGVGGRDGEGEALERGSDRGKDGGACLVHRNLSGCWLFSWGSPTRVLL